MATKTAVGPEAQIRAKWNQMSRLPGGRALFSRMLGMLVPYTGSMGARVEELRPGYARVTLRDRRRVRNHLRSVHAVALLNLAEAATGLAVNFALPEGGRSILRALSMEYHKKARGLLTAEATAPVFTDAAEREIEVETAIRDQAGDVVATAKARWLIGPRR